MTALYKVTWQIEVEADTAREAAELALAIQRDPDSIATCFAVHDFSTGGRTFVDLTGDE